MNIGDSVLVLAPFDEAFPGPHVIERTEITADGTVAYFIDGVEGGFDERFLEVTDGSNP